jgi:hypothetical protein
MFNTKQDVLNAIEDLQMWFAAKPYGWRERATPQHLTGEEEEKPEHIERYRQVKARLAMLHVYSDNPPNLYRSSIFSCLLVDT